MYKNVGTPNILIDLKPGIYTFNNLSASGKSYLCRSLRKLRGAGDKVYGFSLQPDNFYEFEGMYASGKLDDMEVIMFDRYDLYAEEFSAKHADTLYKLMKNCIILIDCKEQAYLRHIDRCYIKLEDNSITVNTIKVRIGT